MSDDLQLTDAEQARLWRERRGLSRKDAATELGLSEVSVRRMERGQLPWTLPALSEDALEAHERCRIMRRRAGFTQAQVASDLGCSRWWLNQIERGLAGKYPGKRNKVSLQDLCWYWEQ